MSALRCAIMSILIGGCASAMPLASRPATNSSQSTSYGDQARALLRGPDAIAARTSVLALFVSGCDAGDNESCQAVIGSRLLGETQDVSFKRAGNRLWNACRKGDFLSCRLAEGNAGIDLDAAALEHACEDGLGRACFELGTRSNPEDRRLVERACNKGFLRACDELVTVDPAWRDAEQNVLQLGCEAGSEDDCVRLASDFPWNSETAAAIREKGHAAAKYRSPEVGDQ